MTYFSKLFGCCCCFFFCSLQYTNKQPIKFVFEFRKQIYFFFECQIWIKQKCTSHNVYENICIRDNLYLNTTLRIYSFPTITNIFSESEQMLRKTINEWKCNILICTFMNEYCVLIVIQFCICSNKQTKKLFSNL